MKKQITHFSVHQTSKVIALIYFVLVAIFAIPWGILAYIETGASETLVIFLAPFIYMILGYILMAIFLFVYNLIAPHFGGIEFTLSHEEVVKEEELK
jgi:hypothetical protein